MLDLAVAVIAVTKLYEIYSFNSFLIPFFFFFQGWNFVQSSGKTSGSFLFPLSISFFFIFLFFNCPYGYTVCMRTEQLKDLVHKYEDRESLKQLHFVFSAQLIDLKSRGLKKSVFLPPLKVFYNLISTEQVENLLALQSEQIKVQTQYHYNL